MNTQDRRVKRRNLPVKLAGAVLFLCILAGIASGQRRSLPSPCSGIIDGEWPVGEFHMARVMYPTIGGGGSHGCVQPWWGIDYPLAEGHFLPALRRLTNMTVADDSIQLDLLDERIYQHPFLFLQQPGAGYWQPTAKEAYHLREHLLRGGFLLIDDFHGEREWPILVDALHEVFPEREIIEIPGNDPIMHIFFDLDRSIQVPGDRHLRNLGRMEPHHWRGIYDDNGHLMVAINFNMDMGDAWEHADDPEYPVPMTTQAYKLGTNYVIYAMTH